MSSVRTTAQFEVESAQEIGDGAYVFARLLGSDLNFKLSKASSLGGCRIEEWLDIPRATGADRKQRYDLFAFRLKSASDLTYFHVGQNVALEG